jgi:hypothetical protein
VGKRHLAFGLPDNGGRRSGIERRQIAYRVHIPERRSGLDRRKNCEDRRGGVADRRGRMGVRVGDR